MNDLSIMEYCDQYMSIARQKTICHYTGNTLSQIASFELKITGMLTINGLLLDKFQQAVISTIFTDPVVRDYVSSLSARFYSLILSKYKHSDIVEVVSEAISENTDPNNSLLPTEITQRLPSYDEIYEKLFNNKWLLFIVLFYLTVPNCNEVPKGSK